MTSEVQRDDNDEEAEGRRGGNQVSEIGSRNDRTEPWGKINGWSGPSPSSERASERRESVRDIPARNLQQYSEKKKRK